MLVLAHAGHGELDLATHLITMGYDGCLTDIGNFFGTIDFLANLEYLFAASDALARQTLCLTVLDIKSNTFLPINLDLLRRVMNGDPVTILDPTTAHFMRRLVIPRPRRRSCRALTVDCESMLEKGLHSKGLGPM